MTGNVLIVFAATLIFVAVMLFGQFAYWELATRREQESKDLARRLGTVADKTVAPLFRLGQRVRRDGFGAYFDTLIRKAGSPYEVSTLYMRVTIFAVIGALIGIAVLRGPFGVVFAILGAVPVMFLWWQADERAEKMTSQLPDGLDLISRSLQAGHGISEAMRVVAEEAPMPLAQEFGRVYEEHNLGRDFRECLQNLTTRNPNNFDLQIFVSSVLLQRETGGNLVEILQSIANTIRSRFVFHGKVRALTSEAKFTAWILGGLPFVVGGLILVVTPEYLVPLGTDPVGQAMVAYCVLSFSFGVFVMWDLSKVEV